MDIQIFGIKIPFSVLIAALGIAAGSGGTVAVASGTLDTHTKQLSELDKNQREYREQQVRVQTLLEQVSKTVERIERKLDAPSNK